jgi:hypothetical protein
LSWVSGENGTKKRNKGEQRKKEQRRSRMQEESAVKIITVDLGLMSRMVTKQSVLGYLKSNPSATVVLRCKESFFQEVSHEIDEGCRRRLRFQSIPRQERGDYHCYCCKKQTATTPGSDYCNPCSLGMANAFSWNDPYWNAIKPFQ